MKDNTVNVVPECQISFEIKAKNHKFSLNRKSVIVVFSRLNLFKDLELINLSNFRSQFRNL